MNDISIFSNISEKKIFWQNSDFLEHVTVAPNNATANWSYNIMHLYYSLLSCILTGLTQVGKDLKEFD